MREATREEIMTVARQQMVDHGAAALSLRSIARQMGLTAPALYRYFPSRDDLVTALIVAAYHSLADAMEAARDARPVEDYAGCVRAMILTYRDWALAHPQDYALIFGTPIPGYHAPAEITMPAAKRSMDAMVDALMAAKRAGRLDPVPVYSRSAAGLQAQLKGWKDNYDYTASTQVMRLALVGWSRLHGLVMLELFNQVQPFFGDMAELYRAEADAILKHIGLRATKQKPSQR